MVVAVLKRQYGNNYWPRLKPEGLRLATEDRCRTSLEGDHPINYFDLKDYVIVAAEQWQSFEPYFELSFWRQYETTFSWLFHERLDVSPHPRWCRVLQKYPPLRWYRALNDLRNRVFHPTRKPISVEEFRFLEDVNSHFESVEARLQVG